MDVKNKKTVLSDEAALYQHKANITEKEKWQQMSGSRKWEYFKEYYLMKLVVTVIVVAVIGSILHTMLSPKPDMLFSVAIINDSFYQESYDEVQEKFEEVLQIDPETQETLFDTGYSISVEQYGSIESLQKFAMYNAVGDLDVTIMPESVFEAYAPVDYFSPVAGHLPTDLYMALSDYLLECQRMDEDGNLIPDSETVFGIDISSTWIYEGQQRTEPMVLAINLATTKEENIEKFLRLLFFSEE